MKDRRPRGVCPICKRSIAVTFNSTITARLRSHVATPGNPCAGSGRAVPRETLR